MPDRRTVVIARPVGRLGNRIILFAHFIGAALEHGFQVVNPEFGLYAHHFPATARDPLCRFPAGGHLPGSRAIGPAARRTARLSAAALHRLQQSGRDVGLIRLSRQEGIDLNGEAFLGMLRRHRILVVQDWYFRNAENCIRHQDAIRAFFTPHPHVCEQARAPVLAARAHGRYVVGVHVRHGDYRMFKDGRYYYSTSQYRALMESVAAQFSDRAVTFFVCSDARIPLGAFSGLDIVPGTGDDLRDMYGLAACDVVMGPPSTFSRWAAYYGSAGYYPIKDPERPVLRSDFRREFTLGYGSAARQWVDPHGRRSASAVDS